MDRYCDNCRMNFSSRSQLEEHMRTKHSGGRNNASDFMNYCQKLGYSRDMAQRALRQLGPNASTNDLLEVVLKLVNAQKHEYFRREKSGSGGGLAVNKRT